MRTLRNNYLKGLILYPRVENGYIKDSLFSYFPHPELNVLNSYFEPLKKESYPLDDDSMLLHLHNMRYFNISNTENVQSFIKKRAKNKTLELEPLDYALIDNYKKFLDIKNETRMDYFLQDQIGHYKKDKPALRRIDFETDNLLEHIISLKEDNERADKTELLLDTTKQENPTEEYNNVILH